MLAFKNRNNETIDVFEIEYHANRKFGKMYPKRNHSPPPSAISLNTVPMSRVIFATCCAYQ